MASLTERIGLHDGNSMPLFGFGCWAMEQGVTAYDAVTNALKAGYRLIDTAQCYNNEESVGKAIRDSGLPRDKIFVVTKLDPHKHGVDGVKESLDTSLRMLGLDHVDLFLIHTPMPGRVLDSWKGMIELKKAGKAKSIGVSNFNKEHVQALMDAGLEKPAVNQFEIHPLHRQDETVTYCRAQNIAVMGYCPLARAQLFRKYPFFTELSSKLHKTEAQLFLRWALQRRFVTIPKSSSESRIKENYQLYDFEISEQDMRTIDEGLEEKDEVTISFACNAMLHPWDAIKNRDIPGSWKFEDQK